MKTQDLTSLLKAMFHQSKEMIIFVDRHGEIVYMNEEAQTTLDERDYDRNQFINICGHCLGVGNNGSYDCSNCFLLSKEKLTFQVYMRTHSGEKVAYVANFQQIDHENNISVFTLNPLSELMKQQEFEHQKLLTQRIIQAQENERKRISRDLHDGVTQELLNLLLEMRLFKYTLDREELDEKIKDSEDTLSYLLDYVRNISVELRPASLDDLGIEAALKTHFKWTEKQYGILIDFDTNLKRQRYQPEIETVVYRVIQEAVFNAAKYSENDEVSVKLQEVLSFNAVHIHFEIRDEGNGFIMEDDPKGSGLGLFGMQERISSVNGTLHIHSEPGVGTKVEGFIPVEASIV